MSTDSAVSETIPAAQLYELYSQNEVAADERFKGRRIAVTGLVKDIGKDITDTAYLILGENVDNPIGTQAMFDTSSSGLSSLTNGERVTVVCVVRGKLMNVILRRCTLR